MANLYEITGELLRLQDILEFEDEIPEDLAAEMEAVRGEWEQKMDGYARILRNLTARRDSVADEAKRLTEMKQKLDSRIEWLRTAVQTSMSAMNVTRVDTPIGTWRRQNNPVKVVVTDETKIPEGFLKYTVSVDKDGLKRWMQETGEVFEGAHLEQTEGIRFK